jgi:pimeloyl-ACP methyl ester carboxylesterase
VEHAPTLLEQWRPVVGERDLIIFDQRGAGLSEPALQCPEMVQAAYDLLDEPDPDVSTQTTYEALMACRERLAQEGHNLSAYNTIQNATDVHAISVALGYDQVNLLGGSYGSALAQAVMRHYPQRVRSVVINSVLPLEKSFFIDSVPAAPWAIIRLLEACAADPACDSAYPELQDVLYETIERLDREPVALTLTHPLSGQRYAAVMTGDGVVGNLVMLLYFFDVPASTQVALKPFTDRERGFRGLVPEGWYEIEPANLVRATTMSDPTAFVLQSAKASAADLLAFLTMQLGLDPNARPVRRGREGVLTWSFYELDLQGYPLDLALAEQGQYVYLVMMVSARDERGTLYEQLFMPAVRAMAPLEQ